MFIIPQHNNNNYGVTKPTRALKCQGRRQKLQEGGAQFKGCEAHGFWSEATETLRRRAPKIWGCNRKPHLLFNDSLCQTAVIQCTVRMCKGIV